MLEGKAATAARRKIVKVCEGIKTWNFISGYVKAYSGR